MHRVRIRRSPSFTASQRAAVFLVATIALTLVTERNTSERALADDCTSYRITMDEARHASISAETYNDEQNDDLSATTLKVAEHFLDEAEKYGSLQCAPNDRVNEYIATDFRIWYLEAIADNKKAQYTLSSMSDMLRDTRPSGGRDGMSQMQDYYRRTRDIAQLYHQQQRDQQTNDAAARCNHPIRVLVAAPPETPLIAQQQGVSGDVDVNVAVDEHGAVTNATIQKTPSSLLSDAALGAALQSTYAPAVKNCKPISSTGIFEVSFPSQ